MSENKKQATNSSRLINLIIAIVIAAFVAVGAYATYGKISDGIEDKAIESGNAEPTVEYMARRVGQSMEDFLAKYGLALGDTINAETTESEMLENMTIENYASYTGATVEEILAGLSDKVTKDTVFKDYMQMPTIDVLGSEETVNQLKEQYNLGDDVTADMSWVDFQTKVVEATQAAALEEASASTEAPVAE